ncbi:CRAL-TRIO domain-containing protein [Smittium culicis]|uniref:CRAL-TRIO domain-containing protein n=1 Tax=Smittium culicis TaxID=133412 RepID=A0A1R1YL20_9FUNG|nr:CRAL-TRIO domain-containing protein [Smittium culicis]
MSEEILKKYNERSKHIQNTLDCLNEEQLAKVKAVYKKLIPLLTENKPIESISTSTEGFGEIDEARKNSKKDPEYYTLLKDKYPNDSFTPEFINSQNYGFRDVFSDTCLNDTPDSLLLRFLRARKWDVNASFEMIEKLLIWRAQNRINELVWYGESHLNYRYLKSGLGYLNGVDKLGNPILYIPVRAFISNNQSTKEALKNTVYVMENARLFLSPQVERVSIIVDTADMGLKNFEMDFFKMFLKFLSDYYPESLELIVIYSSAWVFKGIWNMVKGLLDPVVASKIYFSKNKEDLLNFFDQDQLLEEYGGTNRNKFNYIPPTPNENAKMYDFSNTEKLKAQLSDLVDQFISSTSDWSENSSNNDLTKQRNSIIQKLHQTGLEYDSCVRSKNLYHRKNVL